MFFGVILRQILKKNRFKLHFLAYRDFEIVFDDSFVKFDIVEHNMKIFFKQYESRKILLSNTKSQELNVLKYLNMMLKKLKKF